MTIAYRAGDEIVVNGTTVVLVAAPSFRDRTVIRWGWDIPAADYGSEGTYVTAEAAVASAWRVLDGPMCPCGEPATMAASTRRTCVNCYDRHAD